LAVAVLWGARWALATGAVLLPGDHACHLENPEAFQAALVEHFRRK
jgi:hypothetical protein